MSTPTYEYTLPTYRDVYTYVPTQTRARMCLQMHILICFYRMQREPAWTLTPRLVITYSYRRVCVCICERVTDRERFYFIGRWRNTYSRLYIFNSKA